MGCFECKGGSPKPNDKGPSPAQRGEAHKAKDKSSMKAQKSMKTFRGAAVLGCFECKGGSPKPNDKGLSPAQRGEAHKAKDKSNMKAQKTRWYMCSTEVCILQCNGGACAMLRSTLGSAMLGPESLWRPCGTHVLMKPTFCGTMVSTETLWRLCGTTAPHMDGFA